MRSEPRGTRADGVLGRPAVGYHPRDGAAVACWLLHPASGDAEQRGRLASIARDLGLSTLDSGELAAIPTDQAGVSASDGHAALRLPGCDPFVAEHDEAWLSALADRGWLILIAAYSERLAHASNDRVADHLASGAPAHVGIVRRVD